LTIKIRVSTTEIPKQKTINDAAGHYAGDAYLVILAQSCSAPHGMCALVLQRKVVSLLPIRRQK
jgi:predicted signal transduction protein with EAL and GGDEF domain